MVGEAIEQSLSNDSILYGEDRVNDKGQLFQIWQDIVGFCVTSVGQLGIGCAG